MTFPFLFARPSFSGTWLVSGSAFGGRNSKDLRTQVPTFSQAFFRDQSAISLRRLMILVNSFHPDLSLPRWCCLPKGCLMTCDSQHGPDAPPVSAHG